MVVVQFEATPVIFKLGGVDGFDQDEACCECDNGCEIGCEISVLVGFAAPPVTSALAPARGRRREV
jgi:hypothetical protein